MGIILVFVFSIKHVSCCVALKDLAVEADGLEGEAPQISEGGWEALNSIQQQKCGNGNEQKGFWADDKGEALKGVWEMM